MRFEHETLGQRVRFATGGAADGVFREVETLGAQRVMVIAGPNRVALAEQVTAELPVAVLHDEVVSHVPVLVAERARETATAYDVDAVVSVGGGSATGLAKAVALTTGLPIIAVPTTYAGSEAPPRWGMASAGEQKTGAAL